MTDVGGNAIEREPAPRRQRPAPALGHRSRHAQNQRWAAKWITRTELGDLLAQGYTQSDIARLKNVYDNQVHRAIETLTADADESRRIIGVLGAELRKVKAPALVPQRIEGPVDVVDTLLSVLADYKAARAWLDTEEGQQLAKPRQISYIMQMGEAITNWCARFVDVRHKLLELIAVDTWITELTEMLRDIQREHAGPLRAVGLDLRQVFLDRIRGKILGRSVERVSKEIVAEAESLDPPENGAASAG